MTRPRLTVVGSINVDITARTHRLPAPGETIGNGTLSRHAGGKGANQAVALSRLGADVSMIGAVGDDRDGEWVVASLQRAGVDTSKVSAMQGPTGTALVLIGDDGENEIVVCPGANDLVTLHDFPPTSDPILAQLEIPLHVITELGAVAPGFLAINTAPAFPLPDALIERTDLFIANATEFELTPELRRARLVAVTEGAAGAALLSYGVEIARATAPTVRAVSTVGAGDAFCAALVLAMVQQLPHDVALRIACAVGAEAVTHPEAQPHFSELDSYLQDSMR